MIKNWISGHDGDDGPQYIYVDINGVIVRI